jgi:asparagine synthase (glutamine-hydrolysing)
MCGIAGRFQPTSLPTDLLWHEQADALLAHRGPDGSGHFLDNNCELVHRRLKIIDLSATGNQPMPNEDATVYTVFNGEIYNHQELRSELKKRGHHFRGTSDTEVLVHLYEDFGAGMVSRLRGMFAFAIYDLRRTLLMLARDRFGIKPLYYATDGRQWLFASEIKAVLAGNGFIPRLDRQACYDFLSLSYIPEPLTGFENVQMLPKGTVMVINAEGQRLTSYYRPSANPDSARTMVDAVADVSDSLTRAVQRQRVADVPVAALLSGGIDSSLVVGAFCRTADEPPTTFNVRFPDKQYDETELARAVSTHCRTNHHTINLGDWAVTPESVLELLEHFDQPFADTSLIPMYWVARAIREHGIICALSGDGGDEAFGGYARFWRANTLARMMMLPGFVQKTMIATGEGLAAWTRDFGRQAAKAVRLAQTGREDSSLLMAGLSSYLSESQKEELVLAPAREHLRPVNRFFDGYQPARVSDLETLSQRLTENLFSVGLPSDMLRKVDMMSMRASIEVRVPFLDESVVESGLSLPHRLKTDGKMGKLVLRGLASRWLPEKVVTHRKHGFSIPLDVLATERFHSMLEDYLLSPNARIHSFTSASVLRQWLEMFNPSQRSRRQGTTSREGLYQRIIMLLSMELWLRKHNLAW